MRTGVGKQQDAPRDRIAFAQGLGRPSDWRKAREQNRVPPLAFTVFLPSVRAGEIDDESVGGGGGGIGLFPEVLGLGILLGKVLVLS